MKTKFNVKRKGFTLVELLIVIVVIGVLSAMMMLSSTEAVSSARASNIISNLRNLKTAALAWSVDSQDAIEANGFALNNDNHFKFVKKYLNNESDSNFTGYSIEENTSTPKEWYLKYDAGSDTNVAKKLASRAKSVGLLSGATTSGTNDSQYYGGTGAVYMFVR